MVRHEKWIYNVSVYYMQYFNASYRFKTGRRRKQPTYELAARDEWL